MDAKDLNLYRQWVVGLIMIENIVICEDGLHGPGQAKVYPSLTHILKKGHEPAYIVNLIKPE